MDKLLYFPYISLPQTPWLYKSLLYWDTVETITPSDDEVFKDKHMQELINCDLVKRVYPTDYISSIKNFEEDFLEYVDKRYINNIERYRMKGANLDIGALIHTDKMNSIGSELVKRELATKKEDTWYCIHPSIANDYMLYLATLLGQEVKSQPITDKITNFNLNKQFGTQIQINMMTREELRKNALEGIFPIPVGIENAQEIYDFKKENGEQLKQFRAYIEDKLLNIDAAPEHLKLEMIDRLILNVKNEKDDIAKKMEEKWNVVDSGTLITLGTDAVPLIQSAASGSIPGTLISSIPILGLVLEKFLKVRNNHDEALNVPTAYAFLAEQRFSRK